MKTIIDRSNKRGHSLYEWLDGYHSFSFGNYYNPEKMGFGALRVLNDDIIAPKRALILIPQKHGDCNHSSERRTETWRQ